MEDVLIPFLVRAGITAAIVVAATVAAERAGPFWGGLFAAFPVSAGPAFVMLAMKHDDAFVADAAVMAAAGVAAVAPFLIVACHLAVQRSVLVTLLAGLAAWFMLAVPMMFIDWQIWSAALICLVVFPIAFWLTRPITQLDYAPKPLEPRWYDVPLRALAVGVFVAVVVGLSNVLGAAGSGLGAVFPITFSSVTVILHLRLGGPAAAKTLASGLRTVSGMAPVLLIMAVAIDAFGAAVGLSLALACSTLYAASLIVIEMRKPKPV